MPPEASREQAVHVRSRDATPIGVFRSGTGRPLILAHGTTADHTTFREVAPRFAARFSVHAYDRRGRGASGDAPDYAIEREFEDLAAIAEAAAREHGGSVDVVGHSFGGRCALGAALLTPAIRRVVVYEGAPTPPGSHDHDAALEERLARLLAKDDREGAFELFMREVVGMTEEKLEAYRANPVWPARVAAAPTILREIRAAESPAADLDAVGGVRQPVLQLLGGASRAAFARATAALDERLDDGRVVVIDGARHDAHHTHPVAFVAHVEAFLADD